MSEPTTTADELELTAEPDGKKHRVTLRYAGAAVLIDTFNLGHLAAREKFADAALKKCPGIPRQKLEDELTKLADARPGDTPAADLREVDVRRVVRPELFHTADVSGITVPVVVDAGGKLVTRWKTYLRWADGKREVIDAPERLPLPDGTTLYVHPEPGEAFAADSPAWSAATRRDWCEGCAAPDPAGVFGAVRERFNYHLDFPAETADGTLATLALWTVLTYVYPAWDAVPYLFFGGPMGSGKSRVLDVLQRLVFRPTKSENVTAPTLFRTLHASGGTLLLDEAERVRQSTPDQQEILSMLLAGYRRGGCATRLEPVGDSFRPVRFDVFGPKALACIAGLPPTLASRSIPVMMFRSEAGSEKPKRRLDADPARWQSVRDDLHRFALEHGPRWVGTAGQRDVVPSEITGRNYELWQPLLALAAWFQRQGVADLLDVVRRHALGSIAGAKDDGVPEADEMLLEALYERPTSTSGELLSTLKLKDEATFKFWTAKTVTNRLKVYGIPTPKKVGGARRYEVAPVRLKEIGARYGIELGTAA